MANRKELKGSRKAIKVTLKFTGRFSTSETSALARIFLKITDTGRMDRSQFRDMLHSTFDMNDDGLMDRMFRTFDHDTDGYLNQMEWLAGLWIFLKGNLIEQATYCFQIYDIDEDGYISKDDMFQLLKSSLRPAVVKGVNYRTQTDRQTPSPSLPQITQGKGEDGQAGVEREAGSERTPEDKQTTGPDVMSHEDDPDEGARDLSEIAVTLLDRDSDGRISLDDYLTSIQSDPLLLEVLGPCLPTSSRAAAVLAALGSNNAPSKARQPVRPNPS